MYLGVEMIGCRDAELHLDIALLVGKFPDFLDVSSFRSDDVIGIVKPVESFEHIETGIAPVHNDDERDGVVQALCHVDSGVTLIGFTHSLDDAVLVCPIHEVKHEIAVEHGQVPKWDTRILGFQSRFPLGFVDGELGFLVIGHAERAAVHGIDPVRLRQVKGLRCLKCRIVLVEDVLENSRGQFAFGLLIG